MIESKRWTPFTAVPRLFPRLFRGEPKPLPAPQGFPSIPHLRIVKKLGDGGMASVFLAEQLSTGREVAVKVMAKHLERDRVWSARFLKEAKRMAALSHPNIVPIFDWGNHQGTSYIVMEYIRGGDLVHRCRSSELRVKDVIFIVRQVAAGLDFAGLKGYVHRDVKPENILFREDGSPCILDFGIAKEQDSNTTISSQGLAIGTGAYMSPEQAQPQGKEIDHRSDLYSLGVVLYQMLVGARPFEYRQYEPAQAFQLYLFAHVNTPPPALPEQYEVFQPILDRLLAKDPTQRFERGEDLRLALAELEADLHQEVLGQVVATPPELTQMLTESNGQHGELEADDFAISDTDLLEYVAPRKKPSRLFVGAMLAASTAMAAGFWFWQQDMGAVMGPAPAAVSGTIERPLQVPEVMAVEATPLERVVEPVSGAEVKAVAVDDGLSEVQPTIKAEGVAAAKALEPVANDSAEVELSQTVKTVSLVEPVGGDVVGKEVEKVVEPVVEPAVEKSLESAAGTEITPVVKTERAAKPEVAPVVVAPKTDRRTVVEAPTRQTIKVENKPVQQVTASITTQPAQSQKIVQPVVEQPFVPAAQIEQTAPEPVVAEVSPAEFVTAGVPVEEEVSVSDTFESPADEPKAAPKSKSKFRTFGSF